MKNYLIIFTITAMFQSLAYGNNIPKYNFKYSYPNINSNRVRRFDIQRQKAHQNKLSWFNRNNYGNLTGYSVPINQDVYKQMGIFPYNINTGQQQISPSYNRELFSSPSQVEIYSKNGNKYIKPKEVSGTAGVRIIYD